MIINSSIRARSEVGPGSREQGFTLFELVLAVVLVGILSTVAIIGLSGLTKTGNNSACTSTLNSAQSAASTYYANTGSYPKTIGAAPIGFDALTTATATSPPVLTLPPGVNHAGNVMSSSAWSVTMVGGGANVPNTYQKTTGGVACS